MQVSLGWMQALASLLVIVGTIIGGVWGMVQWSISAKLDAFEVSLIAKLNGTYIRRGECSLMREAEHSQHSELCRRVDRLEQIG